MSSPTSAMSTAGRAFELEEDLDGVGGHGGDLEAIIAASRQRAEAKSTQDLQLELEAVRLRLLRRSQIIDVLRKAYVRDVVTIKGELARKATMTDEEYAAQGGPGTDITDAVPSLDMRPVLDLFSPEDAFLRVESCVTCGGHLEIVTRETKRVVRLTKRISALTAQMDECGKEAAQLKAELMLTRQRVEDLDVRNTANRDALVAKLERTKKDCESDVLALREEARRSEFVWGTKLKRKEEELEVVRTLQQEVDRLREALSQEQESKEEGLHVKDGEIAMLKAKVEDLKMSTSADSKVLLEARNKSDEIQRRLKGEKADHSVTKDLLEEERVRYERCRANLETSQQHLADLNEQFNELRAEVESATETAQDEAGEASDALAASKAEIRRLRTVLSTNDAAAALEESTLKGQEVGLDGISSITKEGWREKEKSEAKEAQASLREAQEHSRDLQAELDKGDNGSLPPSVFGSSDKESSGNSRSLVPSILASSDKDSSVGSAEGLSWQGSFDQGHDEKEHGAGMKRVSSAMKPGGVTFEKGKWVVEKWVALVRFRKAVNEHIDEVTRLRGLLRDAQNPKDRTKLKSELDLACNRDSLVDMEEAMHMEVAALKQRASTPLPPDESGASEGTGVTETPGGEASEEMDEKLAVQSKVQGSEEVNGNLVEQVNAKLEEHVKAHKAKETLLQERLLKSEAVLQEKLLKSEAVFQEKLSKSEAAHKETIKGLRSELAKQKEDLDAFQVEAEEMRERIKKLAKFEKQEKGQNAMNEELRKMEQETGLSVGFESSLEFAPVEGDLAREEEARLIEALENAKSEIKNMKIRQAMVTHELLGTIKGAKAEAELLRAQLAEVTAQRDKQMTLKPLPVLGLDAAEEEEFESLKVETKRQKKANAALKQELHETSEALKTLLEELRRSCKETRRAKTKVWITRDLDRARSIPPPTTPATGGKKVSAAVRRLSVVNSAMRKNSGATKQQPLSSKERLKHDTENPDGKATERVNVTVKKAVDQEQSQEGEEGALQEQQQAELERRREERAARAAAKKLQQEIDEKELQDFQDACASPQSDGVAFATEILEAVQADVKEQFKEAFVELKEALEAHKNSVLRSRVEARERVAHTASLEGEVERLRALLKGMEDELAGKSVILLETEQRLRAEKESSTALRADLAAAKAEAQANVYFKEKNAVLRKQMDHADISARGARQECAKAKWDLQQQATNLAELRKGAEESERREKALTEAEHALQTKLKALATMLEGAEDRLDQVEQQRKARLEALTSTASQVYYGDPELGMSQSASTQTAFHCPRLTLRRINNQRTFPARAPSAGGMYGSSLPSIGGGTWAGFGGYPTAGVVCPTVDGRAEAAEQDLFSPGVGLAAFLDAQSCGTPRTFDTGLDNRSVSLAQLSFRSNARTSATSLCAVGRANPPPKTPPTAEAKHWGLWHDGAGNDTPEQEAWDSNAAAADRERPAATRRGLPETTTMSKRHPARQKSENDQTRCSVDGVVRPQSSPHDARVSADRGGSEGIVARYATSTPPCMQSRLFLQSAMDRSLSSRGWGGSGSRAASPENCPNKHLASSLPGRGTEEGETLPINIARGGGEKHAVSHSAGPTPNGFHDGPTSPGFSRGRGAATGGTIPDTVHHDVPHTVSHTDRPITVPGVGNGNEKKDRQLRQVIDLGVIIDVPRPRVWGERQLMAAAAAATEKPGASIGTGAGASRGDVVLDVRLAKTRETLRSDLLDAAERARLPLLQ